MAASENVSAQGRAIHLEKRISDGVEYITRHGLLGHARNDLKETTAEDLQRWFAHPLVRLHGEHELQRMELSTQQLATREAHLLATVQDRPAFHRLLTVPGLGKILPLTIVYEIGASARFQNARDFSSYGRLVPGVAQSGPVSRRGRHAKQGSPHLKRAFSQAAIYAVRYYPKIRRCFDRHLGHQRGNGGKRIAYDLIARKLAQVVSHILRDGTVYREELRAFVLRKRKVEATVVEGVLAELLQTPLAGPTEWLARVQRRLGRQDLSVVNIERALEPISCVPVLRTLRRQLAAGHVQDQEAWLLTELREGHSLLAGLDASNGGPSSGCGMRFADPTALTALVTPDLPMAEVPGSLCWLSFLMTLCYWNVPLSVLGRWCGGHQTTILRWVVGLARGLWPLVYQGRGGAGEGAHGLCG